MLCEVCKIREANVQYTEVVGGVKTEHHFCSQCAKELDFGPYSAIFDGEFPLAEFLSAILGGETPAQKQDKYSQIVCPTCGMTYSEFVKNSCFGCADCYGVFDVLIHDHIKQLQGSESHKGKRPAYQNVIGDEDESGAGQDGGLSESYASGPAGSGAPGPAGSHASGAAGYTEAGGTAEAAGRGSVAGKAAGSDAGAAGNAEADRRPAAAAAAAQQIAALKRKLKDALRKEDYETAAVCRDQIRALERGAEQNG